MKNLKKIGLYRRFLAYAKPYRWRIIISMLASLVVGGTDAAMAKLVQPFVDYVIVEQDPKMVLFVPALVIGISLLKAIGRYVQNYYIRTAGQLAIQDLRNDVFSHITRLSMRFHLKTSTGSIMSSVLNDIGMLSQMLSETLVSGLREGVTMIALIGVAFYTDWQMALIAFVVLPATAGPAILLARKIKKVTRKSQEAIAFLTTALEQSCSGTKVIKVFGTEQKVNDDFRLRNRTFYNLLRKTFKYSSLSSSIVEVVTSFGVAAVLWMGLERVMRGDMTQGELFSVVAAIVMLYAPVKRLIRVNETFQMGMGAAERVLELQEIDAEIVEPAAPVVIDRARGEVEFDHVDFYYDAGGDIALSDVNLHVSPGEIVALVGASGAGKTTFAGMLCRFYDPESGVIRLDGVDLRSLSLASIHRNITMVDQESFLFNDTIRNNIGYGRDATLEEVRAAARQAYAEEFIENLPDGYDTNIGDRGLRLSGGQRQRICIARAICQDAPVLILDEATSALDTESEAIVQQAMGNLMQGRTTIVIAHRLSTIMSADRIVVMEAGEIREIGSHAELLAHDGLYRKLYDMQFKDV